MGAINGRGLTERTYEGRNFVFNSTTLQWEAMTQPSGGPGGGSTQVSVREIQTSSGASVMDSTETAIKVNVVAGAAGGSTQVSVKEIQTSSGASVMDSTEGAIKVNVVAGAAGGSTLITVRQSTVGDLRAAVYQSTAADLNVTVAGYSTTVQVSSLAGKVTVDQNSTVWPVQIPASQSIQVKNSTIGDLLASVQQNSTVWAVQVDGRVRAQNSTIGDLLASVQQNSTVWAVQVDGRVRAQNSTIGDFLASVQQNSTVWQVQLPTSQSFQVKNSTIGDLLASVQQNSTVWFTHAVMRDSSGVAYAGLTSRPTTGAQAMPTREVLNNLLSTCFSSIGNNSTSATVVTSAASVRHKVYAYSITSTAQAINTLTFASSLANPIWQVQMQSITSGITGANLAVTPPAWLFATDVANPLVFKVTGNTGTYHLSFSYFSEA